MNLLTASERVYRALLIAYPADFRREYAAEMTRLFRDTCRDAYRQGGAAGMLLWWMSSLMDLLVTALEQHRNTRKEVLSMTVKSFLSRNVGLLLIVAGIFIAVASISQLQPDDHYTYYGMFQIAILFVAPGFTLLAFALLGVIERFGAVMGLPGRLSLYLSGAGALAVPMGMILNAFNPFFWVLIGVGFVMHALGLVAFGLFHAWKPFLPIFRFLPLQIASGWLVLTALVPPSSGDTLKHLLATLMMFGAGLAWLAIGLRLHRQQPEPSVGLPAVVS